jgi:hypothetical protein
VHPAPLGSADRIETKPVGRDRQQERTGQLEQLHPSGQRPAGSTRLGPATAPKVVANSTVLELTGKATATVF